MVRTTENVVQALPPFTPRFSLPFIHHESRSKLSIYPLSNPFQQLYGTRGFVSAILYRRLISIRIDRPDRGMVFASRGRAYDIFSPENIRAIGDEAFLDRANCHGLLHKGTTSLRSTSSVTFHYLHQISISIPLISLARRNNIPLDSQLKFPFKITVGQSSSHRNFW